MRKTWRLLFLSLSIPGGQPWYCGADKIGSLLTWFLCWYLRAQNNKKLLRALSTTCLSLRYSAEVHFAFSKLQKWTFHPLVWEGESEHGSLQTRTHPYDYGHFWRLKRRDNCECFPMDHDCHELRFSIVWNVSMFTKVHKLQFCITHLVGVVHCSLCTVKPVKIALSTVKPVRIALCSQCVLSAGGNHTAYCALQCVPSGAGAGIHNQSPPPNPLPLLALSIINPLLIHPRNQYLGAFLGETSHLQSRNVHLWITLILGRKTQSGNLLRERTRVIATLVIRSTTPKYLYNLNYKLKYKFELLGQRRRQVSLRGIGKDLSPARALPNPNPTTLPLNNNVPSVGKLQK